MPRLHATEIPSLQTTEPMFGLMVRRSGGFILASSRKRFRHHEIGFWQGIDHLINVTEFMAGDSFCKKL